MSGMMIRLAVDAVGAACGLALLVRAWATVDHDLVVAKAGGAVILFTGGLTAVSLGVTPDGFMPDLGAAMLLIATLVITRGRVEVLAAPADRRGASRAVVGRTSTTALVFTIAGAGVSAYFLAEWLIGAVN